MTSQTYPESIVDTITQAIEATKNFDKNSNYEKSKFSDEQHAEIKDLDKNIIQFNEKLKKAIYHWRWIGYSNIL